MLDKLYQYFVPQRKSKVRDVAIDAVSILLDWMRLFGKRQQSLAPQKAHVQIQKGRRYQKTSRYRHNPWL